MALRLHACFMVRNEADIWPAALQYNLRFFDHITVVDHQSVDGTREITEAAVAAGNPIDLFSYRFLGYHQNLVTDAMIHRSFALGADWVFPLDADEFVGFTGREALEARLRGRTSIRLAWLNLIPTRFGTFGSFDTAQSFTRVLDPLRLVRGTAKVALSARFARQHPTFRIDMGNHNVRVDGKRSGGFRAGTLFHLPVRSQERLRAKAEMGLVAQDAADATLRDFSTWAPALAALNNSADPEPAMRKIAASYSRVRLRLGEFLIRSPLASAERPVDLPGYEETQARDRALRWREPPSEPKRILLEDGEAVLV